MKEVLNFFKLLKLKRFLIKNGVDEYSRAEYLDRANKFGFEDVYRYIESNKKMGIPVNFAPPETVRMISKLELINVLLEKDGAKIVLDLIRSALNN